MNKKKVTRMVASLALVGAIGFGSTLAYLSQKSDPLVNSFEVGTGYLPPEEDGPDVAVWIDETAVGDHTGETLYDNNTRTVEGNTYTIQVGDKITKDPIVHLTDDSIKSHVIVKVSGLDDTIDSQTNKPKYMNDFKIKKSTDFDINWKKIVRYDTPATHYAIEDVAYITNGYYLYVGSYDGKDENKYIFNSGKATVEGAKQKIISVNFFDEISLNDGASTTPEIEDITLQVCAMQAYINQYGQETAIYRGLEDERDISALYESFPEGF